jgi:hypothetical protein
VSATGHHVLSFVTSVTSEIIKDTATVTGFRPALEEIPEGKDMGCVAEFVMPVFAANGLWLPSLPDGYQLITKITADTAAFE